jgi:gamma-glutamyltranspeptidase/glutathione hydrolase
MTLEDLADYAPVIRKPLQGDYKQYRITSFPPPSSGGVVLLQILKMLEPWNIAASGYGGSRTVHLMVEAERRSYADRARWMGDPDFYDVPVKNLLAADYIEQRHRSIDPDQATRSSEIGAMPAPQPEPLQTLHFSVADGKGAIVAMTTTLNSAYGSGIVATGTGVLLNNEIDDFAVVPGVPNQYGLIGGDANSIQGGKRPLSSMTPTIVEDRTDGNRPVLALGSPGGATIITSVLQVLLNVLDHQMPLQDAVDAPRFHHQWLPDDVRYEPFAFPQDVLDALRKSGHDMIVLKRPLGNIAAIYLDADGILHGAADPRGHGTAEGY